VRQVNFFREEDFVEELRSDHAMVDEGVVRLDIVEDATKNEWVVVGSFQVLDRILVFRQSCGNVTPGHRGVDGKPIAEEVIARLLGVVSEFPNLSHRRGVLL